MLTSNALPPPSAASFIHHTITSTHFFLRLSTNRANQKSTTQTNNISGLLFLHTSPTATTTQEAT